MLRTARKAVTASSRSARSKLPPHIQQLDRVYANNQRISEANSACCRRSYYLDFVSVSYYLPTSYILMRSLGKGKTCADMLDGAYMRGSKNFERAQRLGTGVYA